MKPKILIYDIETTPLLSWNWGIFQQDALRVEEDWYILCFAYKWVGERKTHVVSLPDFALYKKDPKNDYEVVKKLHELFNEADVVVAHNGKRFDQKKSNARFLFHGLGPTSSYIEEDSLLVARRKFGMTSNRLDFLGDFMDLGRKLQHSGIRLWFGCMEGDPKAWRQMIRYNKQDVVLLEKVWKLLRPWDDSSANLALLSQNYVACPKCGVTGRMKQNGKRYTKQGSRQEWLCNACGGYSRSRLMDKRTNDEKPDFI